jgi:hypothetical protein
LKLPANAKSQCEAPLNYHKIWQHHVQAPTDYQGAIEQQRGGSQLIEFHLQKINKI